MEGGGELSYAPLVEFADGADGTYNYGPRDVQDRPHGWAFAITQTVVVGLGIWAWLNADPGYEKLADPSMMQVGAARTTGRGGTGRRPERGDARGDGWCLS